MFFNNKKGMTWEQIMLAVIALIVVVLVVLWFRGGGDKAFDQVGKQIDNLGDCDNDKVANMFDKCVCDATISDKFPEGITKCAHECSETDNQNCAKCGKLTC
ncbi:MAG: hypothetical protein ABIA37_04115 [Candidatus Woesearchaeota archaeon]